MSQIIFPHNHTFARAGVCSPFTSSAKDGERSEFMLPHAQEAGTKNSGQLVVFFFLTRRTR